MCWSILGVKLLAFLDFLYRLCLRPTVYALFSLLQHKNVFTLLILLTLWLVLHCSAKVNKVKLELKLEVRKVEQETRNAAQAAILKQAILFEKELRKLQDEMRELKRTVGAIKAAATASSGERSPSNNDTEADMVESLIVAKKKGLRRMCVAGRGWVPVKRVQHELNLCDQEVKILCSA